MVNFDEKLINKMLLIAKLEALANTPYDKYDEKECVEKVNDLIRSLFANEIKNFLNLNPNEYDFYPIKVKLCSKSDAKIFFEDILTNFLNDFFSKYAYEKYLLELISFLTVLEENQPVIYDNLESIYHVSKELGNQSLKNDDILNPCEFKKTLMITKDFLQQIDCNKELYNLFEKLEYEKRIKAWPLKTGETPDIVLKKFHLVDYESPAVVNDEEKGFIINFPYKEDLRDVSALIHEFFHIVFPCTYEKILLKEMHSIIFENVAIDFLMENGYNCPYLKNYRINNNIKAWYYVSDILVDLIKVKKDDLDLTLRVKEEFNANQVLLALNYLVASFIANYIKELPRDEYNEVIKNILNTKNWYNNYYTNVYDYLNIIGLHELNSNLFPNSNKTLNLM